jgi:hypothetical protein
MTEGMEMPKNIERKATLAQHASELMLKAREKGLSAEALDFLEMTSARATGLRSGKPELDEQITLSYALGEIRGQMIRADDIKKKLWEDRQQGKGNWVEEALRFVESFWSN